VAFPSAFTGALTRVRHTTRASHCPDWADSVSAAASVEGLAMGRAGIFLVSPCDLFRIIAREESNREPAHRTCETLLDRTPRGQVKKSLKTYFYVFFIKWIIGKDWLCAGSLCGQRPAMEDNSE